MAFHINAKKAAGVGRLRAPTGPLFASTALASVMLIAAPAMAQDAAFAPASTVEQAQTGETQDFSIAPQPLVSALDQFSEQTGVAFAYTASQLEGLQAQGVNGTLTPRAALTQLLTGTGVTFEFTGADTVAIKKVEQQENGPAQLGTITVAGQVGADPSDVPFMTPGSSAYISREQIERIPPSSPGDIFIETPGVVAAGNHDGTAINVNIRNAQGLNRVRVMVEGTQQESTGYQGYAGPDQRTYIDPDLIGGVEISKGPGGGPYGTGTTGGIVNVRLLGADDLVPEGDSFGFRLRGGLAGGAKTPSSFASDFDEIIFSRGADTGLRERDRNDFLNDDNWFGSIAGAYRSDRFELVGAFTKRKEGNYFAGRNGPETFEYERFSFFTPDQRRRIEQRFSNIEPGQEVPNTSEETFSFLFRGKLLWNDGQSTEAGYMRYKSEFGHVFPSSLNLWPPQQFALNEVESNRYWLRYQWDSQNDLIGLQANAWHTNAEELGELRQAPQENDAWGVEVWNASSFDLGQAALTLTYGAEYARSEAVVEDGVRTSAIRFTPGQSPTQITPVDDFEGERDVFGAHVGAALMPVEWLTLNAGVRYDRFNGDSLALVEFCNVTDFADVIAGTADGLCGVVADDVNLNGDRFSPRFGVTIEPFPGLQLFGQYSEGYRPLSLVEFGQQATGSVVNPDLRPESVRAWEFGANYIHDGLFWENDAFRAKFVYYHNNYEDFIVRSGFSQYLTGFTLFFDNIPEARVSGFEGALSYDMGGLFADFSFNVFDKIEYCYENEAIIDFNTGNTTTVDGCFNRPPRNDWQGNYGQPEYAGSLTVGTRWLDESLVLGGRMNFFGESSHPIPDLDFNTTFEYWEPTTTLDLFASYQFNQHVSVNASIENVTDRYYLAPLSVAGLPAPGRTARISATIQF